jgi:c-di-GMP-binding flagellar brake protein YcgR
MHLRYCGPDRRRFQRLNVNLSVFFKILTPLDVRQAYGEREREASMLDISGAGCALMTSCDIPRFSIISLRFYVFKTDSRGMVSFSDPVEVVAEVRSVVPLDNGEYRIGVCFQEIKQSNQTLVEEFITAN